MPTDTVLLSIGVESAQAVKARQDLAEMTDAAIKAGEAVVKLSDAQVRAQTQAANWAYLQEKNNAASREASAINDKWIESEGRKAQALGKSYTELLAQEGAQRGLSASQQESLNTIIRYREEYEKAAQAQRTLGQSQEVAAQNTQKATTFVGALTKTLQESSIASIATGAALGTMVGNAVLEGISKLIGWVKGTVVAYAEMQDALVRIDMMLKVVGASSSLTVGHIKELAEGMQSVTRFDATDIERASSSLLKFGVTTTDEFDRAMKAAAGLATIMRSDIVSAAELVGRAMENSYGTMMLRRVGLLNDAQVEYLRLVKELGTEEQYRSEMLRMIEQKTKDAAENTKGLAAAYDQFRNEMHSAAERTGEFLATTLKLEGALRLVTEAIKTISEQDFETLLSKWDGAMKRFIASTVEGLPLVGKAMHDLYLKAAKDAEAAAAAAAHKPDWQYEPPNPMLPGESDQVGRAAASAQRGREAQQRMDTATLEDRKKFLDVMNKAYEESLSREQRLAAANAEFNKRLAEAQAKDMQLIGGPAVAEIIGNFNTIAEARNAYLNKMAPADKSIDTDINALKRLQQMLGDIAPAEKAYADALELLGKAHLSAAEKAEMRLRIEEQLNPVTVRQRELNEAMAKDALKLVDAYTNETDAMEKNAASIEEHSRSLLMDKDQLARYKLEQVETAIAAAKLTLELEQQSHPLESTAFASAVQARIEALEKLRKAMQEGVAAEAFADVSKAGAEEVKQLTAALAKLREHNAEIGRTKEQVAAWRVEQARQHEEGLRTEADAIEALLQKGTLEGEYQEIYRKRLDVLREILKLQRDITTESKNGAAAEAEAARMENIRREAERMNKDINRGLTDALLRGFESGKSFAENFRDTLKNMFATLVLRPIISFILQPISGAITSMLSGLGLGGGGQMGGLGNMLGLGGGGNEFNLLNPSSWSNLFTPPSWYNSLAGSSVGQFLGLSAAPSTFASSFGTPASVAAAGFGAVSPWAAGGISASTSAILGRGAGAAFAPSFGAGIAPLTGAGSIFGAIAPFAPLALMALPFLGGLFDNEPSEVRARFGIVPRGTGASQFEGGAGGTASTRFGDIGFLDRDTMYFSGSAGKVFSDIVAGALKVFEARFSKEQSDHFATILQSMVFESFEGTYTTEDFIKAYGGKIMKQVVSAAFDELGDAALSKAMQGFASEDVTAMTTYVNTLLTIYDLTKELTEADHKRVDAMVGVTQAEADVALAFATAYKTLDEIAKANPLEDARKAIEDSANSTRSAFFDQAEALRDLLDAYDGSLEATQAITAATQAYYVAEVQLLAQIEQVKQAVGDMFGDTLRSMTLATLDPHRQYQYLQDEANRLFAQLQKETDPQRISQLAQKINADINAAFGLLSPQEQRAMLGQFTDRVNVVNQFVQDHLGDISDTIQESARDMFADVHAKLDAMADKLSGAASTMDTAANKQLTAASTPVTINVTTDATKPRAPATSEVHPGD